VSQQLVERIIRTVDSSRRRLRQERSTPAISLHADLVARHGGFDDESGRGFALLDQLAATWGSLLAEEGKAMWFSVPLPDSAHHQEANTLGNADGSPK